MYEGREHLKILHIIDLISFNLAKRRLVFFFLQLFQSIILASYTSAIWDLHEERSRQCAVLKFTSIYSMFISEDHSLRLA